MKFSIFEDDLGYISENLAHLGSKLQGKHIFITGANGFFGIWLIESLLYLNDKHDLGIQIYALSRSKEIFYSKFQHLTSFSELEIVEGNVLDYSDSFKALDYIIHAANLPFYETDNWAQKHIDNAINGTRKIMESAKKHNVESLLFTSSGAIYNNFHAQSVKAYKEDDFAINTSFPQVYSMGKIVSEQLLKDFYDNTKIPVSIARCFAFAGAHLPLENFAFGNFIKNAILNEDIIIKGSGETKRSYLYGADLVVYLLTLLIENKDFCTYNIGSDEEISLKELAQVIGKMYNLKVDILGKAELGNAPLAYVPFMDKFKEKFSLKAPRDLEYCIQKMYEWNKQSVQKKSN